MLNSDCLTVILACPNIFVKERKSQDRDKSVIFILLDLIFPSILSSPLNCHPPPLCHPLHFVILSASEGSPPPCYLILQSSILQSLHQSCTALPGEGGRSESWTPRRPVEPKTSSSATRTPTSAGPNGSPGSWKKQATAS